MKRLGTRAVDVEHGDCEDMLVDHEHDVVLARPQAVVGRNPLEVAFASLFARFSHIALLDELPEYRPNPVLRGLQSLELSLAGA